MKKMIAKIWANYCAVMMEENSDNLKMYEIKTGVHSNVDPARLMNVGSAHCDLIIK